MYSVQYAYCNLCILYCTNTVYKFRVQVTAYDTYVGRWDNCTYADEGKLNIHTFIQHSDIHNHMHLRTYVSSYYQLGKKKVKNKKLSILTSQHTHTHAHTDTNC